MTTPSMSRDSGEIPAPGASRRMWPLYAAGFTTAFGAHGIAASLGQADADLTRSLLYLGLLLALYDGAEVILKPVFGTLADRIGARLVLLGGLAAFAAASVVFVIVRDPSWLWAARLGQGAAASAFSPAASALVARLNPQAKHGRAFGTYGFYKSLGYTAGPLLGGLLVWAGGLTLLFAVLAVLAATVAGWAALAVPSVPPLPRARQTVLDLARRLADLAFLRPTMALAAATAALSVGVGFLPVSGAAAGLGPLATGAAISVLAACAALVQPRAGRALDAGRLTSRTGLPLGLLITAAGLAAAMLPGPDRRPAGRRPDRNRHRTDHPARLRFPGRGNPARTPRADHGRSRTRPRTRRRRRPPACRHHRHRRFPHQRLRHTRPPHRCTRSHHDHKDHRPPRKRRKPLTNTQLTASSVVAIARAVKACPVNDLRRGRSVVGSC
ncbi:MFS transporter [Streptomyces sp. NPDC055817]